MTAMPDLNLDRDYLEHPKTMLLAADLGDWAEILPIRLWLYTAKYHAETGIISGPPAKLLEARLKWRGEKGKGIEALVEHGFLERIEDGFVVHDFVDRNEHIKALSERNRAAAKSRWAKIRDPSCTGNADASKKHASALPAECIGNAPTNQPPKPSEPTLETNQPPLPGEDLSPGFTVAEDLAQRFWMAQRGKKEDQYKLAESLREMIRVGYDPVAVRAEIDRTDRDRSEWFSKMKDRLEKARNAKPRPANGQLFSDAERELMKGKKITPEKPP